LTVLVYSQSDLSHCRPIRVLWASGIKCP